MTVVLVIGWMVQPLSGQESLWKCEEPDRPFRFAFTPASRDEQTPPCEDWVEMRGEGVAMILGALGERPFEAANYFLAAADQAGGTFSYPSIGGAPATTKELYQDPARFGFRSVDLTAADPGSLVLYDGLGGILVEVRDDPESPWQSRVLYPSRAEDFHLRLHALVIPGMDNPKILVREPGMM